MKKNRKSLLAMIILTMLFIITGCVESTKTENKITITRLTLATTSSTITVGSIFVLPKTATAIMSDNATKEVSITWDKPINTTTSGNFIFIGSSSETALTVSFTLTVYNFETKDLDVNNCQITKYVGSIKTIIIPEKIKGKSVTSIGNDAFSNNQLTDVTIPNSVTSIGDWAFTSNQLTSITIPNSVTSIGDKAFYGNQLTSITIPNSVTSIGFSAFYGNQLTSVTIPNSVTSIGFSAFYGNQLTSIIIPNGVTSIGDSAFAVNHLTSITIPNSVTSIGRSAFVNNQLTSITIPNSVTSIGNYAFADNQLTRVTIPNSVTSIGDGAFRENPLKTIRGKTGSYAEKYARDKGYTFEAIEQ